MQCLFVLALLVPLSLACPSTGGALTATPSFKFIFSPPAAWSYNNTAPTFGQSTSETQAKNRINADIEYAIMKALASYGYSSSGVTFTHNINAITAAISSEAACTTPAGATHVLTDGALTQLCTPAPYKVDGSIRITSPIALSESQWESIGIRVWSTLTDSARVKFYGLIDVV